MNTEQFYQPFNLDISNYWVSPTEISNGYCNRAWDFTENLPFLGPTVPPVESNDEVGYVEHPSAVFEYYKARGVTRLYAEEKYMGSRATIFVDRGKIQITSRGGFPYFKPEDQNIVDAIKAEVQTAFPYDFVLLDAEIMPWLYKGDNLIKRCFLQPGASAKLFNKYSGFNNPNVEKYFDSLNHYIKNTKTEVRVFDILLLGNYGKRELKDVFFGYHAPREETYKKLTPLFGEYVKPVVEHITFLGNDDRDNYDNTEQITKMWLDYCATGGEGFVFKTPKAWSFQQNGYLLQPMMKVRGKEYLRLIYGIDYDEPQVLAKLKQRNVRKKRQLAIQEFELTEKMLRAAINGASLMEIKRLACAFLGMDSVSGSGVDATL